MKEEIKHAEIINDIAESIYHFAIDECSKKKLEPIDLVACLASVIVNANYNYAKDGEERQAFENLISALRDMFDEMEKQSAVNVAMVEKIIADIEGKIQ